MTFVTSHLVVSNSLPDKISGEIVRVTTPDEAVEVIERGGTAVLPEGAFEAAAQVLRLFGADEAHIAWQVYGTPYVVEGSERDSHCSGLAGACRATQDLGHEP